ncbi:MAG: DUF416 family protein [Spongiibacteraceae bacterium]
MKASTEIKPAADAWLGIAHAAALITRMLPNYTLFSEVTGSGDSKVFNNILDLIWEYAAGHNQRIDFQKQQDKLEEITPNPDNFDVYGVWPAMDATVALASLLSACERWDQEELESVGRLSLSTIERYLEVVGESDDDAMHPLIQAEQEFVAELNALVLAGRSKGRPALVMSLKRLACAQELSNIGLERG